VNKARVDIKSPVPFLLNFTYSVMQFFPETCKFLHWAWQNMTINSGLRKLDKLTRKCHMQGESTLETFKLFRAALANIQSAVQP